MLRCRQETVARLHYRGHANRRLARIALDGPVAPGDPVTTGDAADGAAPVGEVTSVAEVPGTGWMALAMVRHEVPDGTSVGVGHAGGRVLPPA